MSSLLRSVSTLFCVAHGIKDLALQYCLPISTTGPWWPTIRGTTALGWTDRDDLKCRRCSYRNFSETSHHIRKKFLQDTNIFLFAETSEVSQKVQNFTILVQSMKVSLFQPHSHSKYFPFLFLNIPSRLWGGHYIERDRKEA